jgi:hypothetical protein
MSALFEQLRARRLGVASGQANLLSQAKWPGAALPGAGGVTSAGRRSRPRAALGTTRAPPAEPGHFAWLRALSRDPFPRRCARADPPRRAYLRHGHVHARVRPAHPKLTRTPTEAPERP